MVRLQLISLFLVAGWVYHTSFVHGCSVLSEHEGVAHLPRVCRQAVVTAWQGLPADDVVQFVAIMNLNAVEFVCQI